MWPLRGQSRLIGRRPMHTEYEGICGRFPEGTGVVRTDRRMGTASVITAPLRRVRVSTGGQAIAMAALDVAALAVVVFLWHPRIIVTGLVGVILLIVIRWRLGLYRVRFSLSSLDELPRAIEAGLVSAGILAVVAVTPWVEVTVGDITWVVLTGAVLGLLRVPLYLILRLLRHNDVVRERLLLVGGGVVADAIAETAEDKPDYGLDLAARVPNLITVDLPTAAEEAQARTVLIAFSRASEAREVFEIRRGLAAGLTIMAVPRYFDLIGEGNADDEIFGVPVLRLGVQPPTFGLVLKRGLDVLLAGTGLVMLSPLLLVAGLLVRRETGGALLFRQTRIGKGGKTFQLLKLQTMRPALEGLSDTTWAVPPSSDEIGPVGSFLRRTSLDELPQLWNILRGDMSFVGPRPERPYFAEQFREEYPHYADRLRMSAGLTGLAQIHDLRGDTSIDDRARFDNRYSDSWSLWTDIKILLRTVPKVWKGSGR